MNSEFDYNNLVTTPSYSENNNVAKNKEQINISNNKVNTDIILESPSVSNNTNNSKNNKINNNNNKNRTIIIKIAIIIKKVIILFSIIYLEIMIHQNRLQKVIILILVWS